MTVLILSPEGTIYNGTTAQVVSVPGTDGEFTVLTGHAPVISTLEAGVVRVDEQTFEIRGGFVEVLNDTITICAS